jgi:hypothetical protein
MDRSQAGKKGYEKTREKLNAHRDARSKRLRDDYAQDPKICPTCGKIIPFEKRRNKFCSKSCSASFNNRGVRRVQTVHDENCAYCGKPKEKLHNKYCDACIEANVYSNQAKSLDEIKTDRHRRLFLIRENGHQCEVCGLSEWMGQPIPLELDHIDGNPDNNRADNLRILCPNCHAQTEFYKGAAATEGKGRHSIRRAKRRKRYKNGESY